MQNTARGVRWVKPGRMHLTLAFLGEVDGDFVASAKRGLSDGVRESVPFSVRLDGFGAFPNPGRARVIWVGVDEGRDALCRLQKLIVKELRKIGYRPERRPFSPHLTLGRLRVPADVSGVCACLFQSDEFLVDRVALYESVLRPQGPEYTRLAESAFRGKPS